MTRLRSAITIDTKSFRPTVFAGLLFLFCLLVACAGGDESNPASCLSGVVRIELYGDSTMWGYDGAAGTGAQAARYPESVLRYELESHFGKNVVSVTSKAVSGTASWQLLNGVDGVNGPWPTTVSADLVVINFGVNDKATSISARDYQENLLKLSHGEFLVIFQTPLPVLENAATGKASSSYAPEMRSQAAELGVPIADAAAYASALPAWFSSYAPDGLHPTASGYDRLTRDVLAPTVIHHVERLRCK